MGEDAYIRYIDAKDVFGEFAFSKVKNEEGILILKSHSKVGAEVTNGSVDGWRGMILMAAHKEVLCLYL